MSLVFFGVTEFHDVESNAAVSRKGRIKCGFGGLKRFIVKFPSLVIRIIFTVKQNAIRGIRHISSYSDLFAMFLIFSRRRSICGRYPALLTI